MSAQWQLEEELVSEAEYFDLLEKSDVRLEWVDGHIRAMAGGSSNHATLFQRFATAINRRLGDDASCEARTADIKVRVEATNANYLPDVVFYCDDATFDESRPDWLLTPLLIVETLSPSTEKIDENEKIAAYFQIPSLLHYLIVSQRRVFIKHYRRNTQGEWVLQLYQWRNQEIPLDFLNISLPVAEIYRRLDVPEGFVLIGEEDEA